MKEVVSFRLVGTRPIAWTTPRISHRGRFKDPRLKKWQEIIGTVAKSAMERAGRTMVAGPVSLAIRVYRPLEEGYNVDDPAWVAPGKSEVGKPNLTNILKAIEDGLQGAVYENDKQVVRQECSMRYGEDWEVRIAVFELGDEPLPDDCFD